MFTEGYIGFTSIRPKKRWNCHRHAARRGFFKYPICRAITKYTDTIRFDVLVVGDADYCLDLENHLRPSKQIGWNIGPGGQNPNQGNRGRTLSPETRAKISAAHKGKKLSDEQKQAISAGLKISFNTPEMKLRLRQGQLNRRKPTDEERAAISAKISARLKGRIRSPEEKAAVSARCLASPRVPCPHCGKLVPDFVKTRYHFDNCKHKVTS